MQHFHHESTNPTALADCVATLAEGYYRNELWFSNTTCQLESGGTRETLRHLRAIRDAEDHAVMHAVAEYFGETLFREAAPIVRSVARHSLQQLF